jgi:septal ring factor EnvC (AmiA/AmiB activator)
MAEELSAMADKINATIKLQKEQMAQNVRDVLTQSDSKGSLSEQICDFKVRIATLEAEAAVSAEKLADSNKQLADSNKQLANAIIRISQLEEALKTCRQGLVEISKLEIATLTDAIKKNP